MVERGEEEPGTDLLEAAAEISRSEIDPDAEGLENVGTTARRGDAAVAVLHHRDPAGGEDKDGGRRDIE
jgi:hypothetical protein